MGAKFLSFGGTFLGIRSGIAIGGVSGYGADDYYYCGAGGCCGLCQFGTRFSRG